MCAQRGAKAQPSGRSSGETDVPGMVTSRAALGLDARHRAEQPPGVGVARVADHLASGADLGGATGVHDDDPVGHLGDHAHVVGDDHDRRAVGLLQLDHQVEDLRLGRDVERRRRLVGDQQLRVARQRHGDDDALAHAAGELVRVVVDAPLGVGDADLAQQLDRPLARACCLVTSVWARICSTICQPTV